MVSFQFRTVPNIVFEVGAAQRLGEFAAPCMTRPMVVTDPGIIKAGLIEPVLDSLRAHGLEWFLYDKIEADPPVRIINHLLEIAAEHHADGVIGFGGGSSMDSAKLIAVLMNSDQRIEEIFGTNKVKGDRKPLILAPTTAGTGSEVTDIAVVTTEDNQKMGILGDRLFADIAVLDPLLTIGLPRPITAATGIDAIVHAIEAYTNRLKKNPVSDTLAREAMRLLVNNIITACDAPEDLQARTNMLLGAMLAGQAFTNSPVGAVHAMAYPLGALFHVPHGLSNALMLEPVLRFNANVCAPLYAELGDAINANATGGFVERADAFIGRLTEIIAATGVERRLSQVGVSQNDLPRLAEDAIKVERLMVNNPRPVTLNDALAMYTEVL